MKKLIFNAVSTLVVVGMLLSSIAEAQTVDNVNAVIGLGFSGPSDSPDYNLNNNALSSTHEGKATPQYMLGLAYAFSFKGYKGRPEKCGSTATSDADAAAQAELDFRCHPLGAFVSAKFSSEASSAVNGVTFGITHKIAGNLSFLAAWSLSPFQQPSPGFINAAAQTVKVQQAANNSFYNQFDPVSMKNNQKDAFDGFPTVLMTTTGTATSPTYTPGAQIYNGNVLVTNYRSGFLVGVALTPNAIKLLTGK